MNYRDIYFSRINHLGSSTAERVHNTGVRSFEKWLNESVHTVNHLSVERGLYFRGIILTNKDKEYEKIMFLNVANDLDLRVGDIMVWPLTEDENEHWLLFKKERKTNELYQTFWITRCNYLLKWIDNLGHLQQSWSVFVSSLDSKIKGNFRTWNALITPQPNKYAEILMPRYPIERATNFIVEDESWSVIEYDWSSVPGVIYLSLTENKVNMIYDDLVNDIADTDKLANYQFVIPEEVQTFAVDTKITPNYTLTKNGIPIDMETICTSNNHAIVTENNGELFAVAKGEVTLKVQVKDYPQIVGEIPIIIAEENNFNAYIEGKTKIHLDREAVYVFKSSEAVDSAVNFTIDNVKLAVIQSVTDNSCIVHANANNELGSVVLSASYKGHTYTKTIQIIPLW